MESSTLKTSHQCWFCGGSDIRLIYADTYHNFKPDFGPFSIFKCSACGSALTLPPPPQSEVEGLYLDYDKYRGDAYQKSSQTGMLEHFYESCMCHLTRNMRFGENDRFTWFDIGSGNGEMASRMAERFPNSTGLAFDLTDSEPSWKARNVTYRSIDLNNEGFSESIGEQADVVYGNFVLEHVLRPDFLLKNMMRLVKPSGLMYATCPDFGSLAAVILGRKWPNMLPGEHVNIPTRKGARKCVENLIRESGLTTPPDIAVRPLYIRYSVQYVLKYFGFDIVAKLFPKGFTLPTPAGSLEIVVNNPPLS